MWYLNLGIIVNYYKKLTKKGKDQFRSKY